MAIPKTNAARHLDNLGIAYELYASSVDPDDLSAVTMAQKLHVPPEQLFKTLVARGVSHDGSMILMACIPAPSELDLKKIAHAAACKSVAMVPLNDVLPLTGYMRGGCSPIAPKKQYPVFLDEQAILWESIYISAGQRGVLMRMATCDFVRATDATYADLVKE